MSASGQASSTTSSPRVGKRRSRVLCCLRCCGVLTALLVVLPALGFVALLTTMMFRPLNVTPLVRPFMPIVIARGAAGAPPRGRLAIGHAELQWMGLRDGFGSPVLLRLHDVTILGARENTVDRIRDGAVALDAFPLFRGRIAITNLQVGGARLALRRDEDGDVDLDYGDNGSSRHGGGLQVELNHLHHLALSDAHVEVNDRALHARWIVDPVDATLTPVLVRWRRGLVGSLTIGVAARPDGSSNAIPAPFQVSLNAHGDRAPGDLLAWHVAVAPTTPAGLAPVVPALAAMKLPLGLTADVTLHAGRWLGMVTPRDATVTVTGGEGEVDAAGSTLFTQDVEAHLRLEFPEPPTHLLRREAMPARLDVTELRARLRPPPSPLADSSAIPLAETRTENAPATTDGTAATPTQADKTKPSEPAIPKGATQVSDTQTADAAEAGSTAPTAQQDDPGLTATASGALSWSDIHKPTVLSGDLSAALTDIPFVYVARYWPALAGKGARKWVTQNITAGMLRNTHVSVSLIPGPDGRKPVMSRISGGLDGEGLDVHWLRPIAPLHGVDAHLSFVDPKTIMIRFDHGYQLVERAGRRVDSNATGKLALGVGSMEIRDLDKKDQTGVLDITLAGDLRDHIAVLSEPRLHILSKHPLPFTHPSGWAVARSKLELPLESHITTDDMRLDGHAQLTHVHLGDAAIGRDMDDATIAMDVTMKGLTLTGSGLFAHIPTDVQGSVDFDAAPPRHVVDKVDAQMHMTPENAVLAGIPVDGRFDGVADMNAKYASMSDGTATLGLNLDLTRAAVHIPMWSKPANVPANASVQLTIDHGSLSTVTDIRATGPDLTLSGEAKLHDGAPPELIVPEFHVGRSNGSASFTAPMTATQPISVHVKASTLDLTPLVQGPDEKKPAKKPTTYHVPQAASGKVEGPPGRPWFIDVDADTLYYSKTGALGGVSAHIEHNGVRLQRLRFSMASPSTATAVLEPVGATRRLTADVTNFGMLAARTGVVSTMSGGNARLEGHFDDSRENAPFHGRLNISPFVITKAPDALLMARSLSIYGWFNARKNGEFEVDRFSMPVSFADGVLHIEDGRAGNGALGATIEGPIDLDHGTMNLAGTIVPAFAVNALPGKLPGVGKLFSPEKDGGLLAVKFAVNGKLDDPAFSVSPFTIFLPGVLRDMF
ncbi:hypothetical protein J2D73_05240 [Acetobacter sacchari]|uniref:AsmA-like C-terminal domain-containing protein n=1 Tax=Acetobacter sacchari TaxID=2661687 RepID=A0ABS3LTG3_9PROT|nr:hypothetical protein [Acetobacter sacchari]